MRVETRMPVGLGASLCLERCQQLHHEAVSITKSEDGLCPCNLEKL